MHHPGSVFLFARATVENVHEMPNHANLMTLDAIVQTAWEESPLSFAVFSTSSTLPVRTLLPAFMMFSWRCSLLPPLCQFHWIVSKRSSLLSHSCTVKALPKMTSISVLWGTFWMCKTFLLSSLTRLITTSSFYLSPPMCLLVLLHVTYPPDWLSLELCHHLSPHIYQWLWLFPRSSVVQPASPP